MKTPLLLLGIFAGLTGMTQTLEENDTIYNGNSLEYYVLDSNVTAYPSVSGTGVTWDYSAIGGYTLPSNTNNVINASASSFASDYPSAAYSEDFENSVKTFFTNDDANDQVIVHGFVFQQGANDFIIKYDDDQLISAKFPMNQGDTYTDDIEGTASAPFGSTVINANITGSATVTADGSGTLIIGGNTYTDVLRIHTDESASGIVFGTSAVITRKTYVYYDVAANNMPIFIHAEVGATVGTTDYGFKAVYSKDDITASSASTPEFDLIDLSIYPNPVSGDFVNVASVAGTEKLAILNSLGQVITSITNPNTLEKIDLSAINQGIYFVQITKGDAVRTEKFIVK